MDDNSLILTTNDDGHNSAGMKVLNNIAKMLTHNVWCFAPLKNNSGKSHALTINKKIKIDVMDKKIFVVDGTPVDCVIFGTRYLSKKKLKPKVLLSGVNHGQNLGLDIFYSGTVAAAREGAIQSITSFSISLEKNKYSSKWNTVKYFLPKILNSIIKLNLPSKFYYNINFPNCDIKSVRGYKLVSIGNRKPGEIAKISSHKKNSLSFFIPSERKIHQSASVNEDEYELKKKFITITYHSYLENEKKNISNKLTISLRNLIEK